MKWPTPLGIKAVKKKIRRDKATAEEKEEKKRKIYHHRYISALPDQIYQHYQYRFSFLTFCRRYKYIFFRKYLMQSTPNFSSLCLILPPSIHKDIYFFLNILPLPLINWFMIIIFIAGPFPSLRIPSTLQELRMGGRGENAKTISSTMNPPRKL